MKLTVFVIVLISGAWALPQPLSDADFLKPSFDPIANPAHLVPRIVNGAEATPHSIPYQVFLNVFSNVNSWYCSGSVVSENYVLTAAHCLRDAVKAEVYLGFHNLGKMDSGAKLLMATNFITHENYTNTNGILNDIGVIRLSQPVVLNSVIGIAPLPSREEVRNNYEGDNARVSGWGRVQGTGKVSSVLLQANATVISNNVCGRFFRNVQEYNLCTSGDLGVATCKGDSGGPLVVGSKQVAVVSFGVTDCLDGYPSAYTRIADFFDWIEDHTDVKF